ncbi:hypothetical protein HAX54_010868, partial [Datura stramonium]|nr:hypothetical protein [Datura stramonium]
AMDEVNNVDLTKAQLAAATRNAQQGLRNQPPMNRRAPPTEEPNFDQTRYAVEKRRAEDSEDGEESLPEPVVADKPVVTNVNPEEMEKHLIAEKEDVCKKEKEKEKPKRCTQSGVFIDSQFAIESWPTDALPQPQKPSWVRLSFSRYLIDWTDSRVIRGSWFLNRGCEIIPWIHPANQAYIVLIHGATANFDRYCTTLVREFYASYVAAQKHQKATGPLRLRPCLEKVKVRGVEIQDEMNPKLKKRKREPVVARDSETYLGIDSQPDLGIFDVPLPKDEVFEDERVETDEKELEDDHVKKELDKER